MRNTKSCCQRTPLFCLSCGRNLATGKNRRRSFLFSNGVGLVELLADESMAAFAAAISAGSSGRSGAFAFRLNEKSSGLRRCSKTALMTYESDWRSRVVASQGRRMKAFSTWFMKRTVPRCCPGAMRCDVYPDLSCDQRMQGKEPRAN
jgi:hypothetical protein